MERSRTEEKKDIFSSALCKEAKSEYVFARQTLIGRDSGLHGLVLFFFA